MYVISLVSGWLKDIVILFILISISELIMPKGNMKKYINMVIGLLIIFTIINPFAKLLNPNFDFGQSVFNYSKSDNFESLKDNELYIQQEKQIEKMYKEKISKEITELIEEKTNYKVIDIVVGIMNNEESYGEIDYLNISIGQEEQTINEDKIHIEKVRKVEVQKDIEEIEVLDGKYEDIKEIIYNNYLVDRNRINIEMNKKEKGE